MNKVLTFGDKEQNKVLVKKYPFLLPKNRWTGEVSEDYEYEYTEADAIEDGWWKCFGIQLLDDLKDVLERNNCLNDYGITEIKEKWGSLCWYDWGAPEEWYEHMDAWEFISAHTCIICGEFPVPARDPGWVSPWCDRCYKVLHPHLTEERIEKTTSDMMPYMPEFLEVKWYSDGYHTKLIDMKPYYEKIGYKYDRLATVEETQLYEGYQYALKLWKRTNGEIKEPMVIPYEIQEMNPFKEK